MCNCMLQPLPSTRVTSHLVNSQPMYSFIVTMTFLTAKRSFAFCAEHKLIWVLRVLRDFWYHGLNWLNWLGWGSGWFLSVKRDNWDLSSDDVGFGWSESWLTVPCVVSGT